MPVVVVESPAKAKTINKYLGPDYTVLASYGHVRDLPSKDGSVDPEHGFDMTWEVATDSKKHVKAIADALKDDPDLILATDPDREGEAISWHLKEALEKRKAIKKDTTVRRVTFNAITKDAVTRPWPNRAMSTWNWWRPTSPAARSIISWASHSRRCSGASCRARNRRAACSPWRCASSSTARWRSRRSARANTGRCAPVLETPRGKSFEARLVAMGGKKLDRYDLATEAEAGLAVKAVSSRALTPSRGWRPSPPRATPRRPS
jgi:DNA topoisomerase-1